MADGEVKGSLTDLPEGIIHHILSFLPTKEATKTSTLSKAWFRAVRTCPLLDFDLQCMISWDYDGTERRKKYRGAIKHIISTLRRYKEQKIGLQKLVMVFEANDFDGCHLLDQCIELAAENRPRQLHLWNCFRDLPQSVLEVESLENLILEACCLKHQKIECRNLKGLELFMVSLDEKIFGNIITSCPLIETLEIGSCQEIRDFKVTNLHNLKRLIAETNAFQNIEVEEPNLECVHCIGGGEDYATDLTRPCWIKFPASQYRNLKELLLSGVEIYDIFFVNIANKFPQLEDISIQDCQNLQRIKISSNSLKVIQLLNCYGLEEAHFDVPRIVLFDYYETYRGENATFPRLSFTAGSGKWASYIKVVCVEDINTSFFLKLKEFLTGLNQSEVCLHPCFLRNVAFNAAEVTSSAAALSETEDIGEFCVSVSVDPWSNSDSSSCVPILNGILWICRPRTITMDWTGQPDTRFIKLMYKILVLMRNPNHSQFQQINTWQGNLKGARDIEIFQGYLFRKGLSYRVFKFGKGGQLPKAIDWGSFWKEVLINTQNHLECGYFLLSFNLEWKSYCNLQAIETKRFKLA